MNGGLLGLEYLRVVDHSRDADIYHIRAESVVLPTACPECRETFLHRHGSVSQVYLDCPIHGNKTVIEVSRRRLRCQTCKKTFFEPLPDFDSKRSATLRLVEHIKQRCFKHTFLSIAQDIGVDEKTVRNIFEDHIAEVESKVHFETPIFMGIDEIKVVGKPRAVITNVGKNSLYDMLPSRRQDSLIAYFNSMKGRERIQSVAIDMWRPYRDVVAVCLPNAKVVIDKFHVVRMANDALERVRKSIRKQVSTRQRLKLKDDRFTLLKRNHTLNDGEQDKLQEWAGNFPDLGRAYELKEGFFNIWNAASRNEAEGLYDEWAGNIDDSMLWAFEDLLRAVGNWRPYIFNYFDHPITNAYTESVNNLIKSVNRVGCGYSFEVLRARLLYNEEARSDTRSSIRKRVRKSTQDDVMGTTFDLVMPGMPERKPRYKTVTEERTVEYGPYIPTLVRLLEAGEFS